MRWPQPAFVLIKPPICPRSLLLPSNGKVSPSPASASVRVVSATPASTVTVRSTGSMARIRFIRPSDRMMPRSDGPGTAPPFRPVLPPCGTIATRPAAQSSTTARS